MVPSKAKPVLVATRQDPLVADGIEEFEAVDAEPIEGPASQDRRRRRADTLIPGPRGGPVGKFGPPGPQDQAESVGRVGSGQRFR